MQLKKPTILFGITMSDLNIMNSDDIKAYIHDVFPTEPRPTRILESPVDPSRFKNCVEEDMVHIFTGKCWTDITAESFKELRYDSACDVFLFFHQQAQHYYLPAYLKLFLDDIDGKCPEMPRRPLQMDLFIFTLSFSHRTDGEWTESQVKARFDPLTRAQKGAVSLCMSFYLEHFLDNWMQYTNDHYWRPNADFSFLKPQKMPT